MVNREYNQQILQKIEKSIDALMPAGAVVAMLGILNVIITQRAIALAVYDAVLALSLVLLFVYRRKMPPAYKIAAICGLILVLAFLSLRLTGLHGIGPQLLVLSTILVVGFFSRRSSQRFLLVKNGLTLGFVLLIQLKWITFTGPGAALSNIPKNWFMTVLIVALIDLVLIFVINAIKSYLIAMIKTSKIHVERIYHLAFFDALTKLPNKAKLQDAFLQRPVAKAMVIEFSVDGLSTMNSIYGITKTDEYIQHLAKRLTELSRSEDHVARVSGNEFLWLMPGVTEAFGLERYQQLIRCMQDYELSQHTRQLLHYTAGYLLVDEDLELAEVLERTAIAIEQARLQDNTDILPYNLESQKHFLEQERLKVALAKAIREKHFSIFYQEKMDTKRLRVVGVEALARWTEEGSGFVSPGVFIPLLKKINATLEFDLMITELVFGEFPRLQAKYPHAISVSINISPLSLITQSFIDQVISLSAVYGVQPSSFYFELTEDAFFESFEDANRGIEQLRAQGFKISIDDFGSGYTAISYIFKLQFDELKMDRSFVQQLASSDVNNAILKTLISLRDTYQYAIVAEGVESQTECELLQAMDCWQVQGYLFSKPMPCEQNEVQNES